MASFPAVEPKNPGRAPCDASRGGGDPPTVCTGRSVTRTRWGCEDAGHASAAIATKQRGPGRRTHVGHGHRRHHAGASDQGGSSDVGTLAWAERTGGRLDAADRVRSVGQLLLEVPALIRDLPPRFGALPSAIPSTSPPSHRAPRSLTLRRHGANTRLSIGNGYTYTASVPMGSPGGARTRPRGAVGGDDAARHRARRRGRGAGDGAGLFRGAWRSGGCRAGRRARLERRAPTPGGGGDLDTHQCACLCETSLEGQLVHLGAAS